MANDPLLAFRSEFPILERSTYLVSNSLGAMPRSVTTRLAEYADAWAGEGVGAWLQGWWELPVRVGDEIAPLIGAGSHEISMQPNVTLAHAVVLSALDYSPRRDTIVMTELDFPSVRYVVDQLAPRLGARVKVIPSADGVSIDMQQLLEAVDDRVRLVAVSHVLFRSAFIVDAAELCRRAHEVGALVLLDAFHSVGVLPVDVKRWGVDFLAGGVLKWLCGGPGACFLYASPAVSERAAPALTGWQAHSHPFDFAPEMDYATGAWRWLNGTPCIPALYAATEGPAIVRRVGVAAIREKSMRQTARLIALSDDRGYQVRTPRDPAMRGGTVTLDVPHGYEVSRLLHSRRILVDYRPGAGIRIAPHFYTADEELDAVIEAVGDALAGEKWKQFSDRVSVVT